MERAAFVIYMIVLVLSILLFGAVHTYAYTLMILGVLAATLLIFARNIKKEYRSGRYSWRFPKTSLNILFLVLFCFLVFQLIPMPAAFVKLLSPEAAVVQEKAAACSSVVMGQAQDAGAWYTLAPYTHPVRMSMIRWIVYGLFFMGLIQVLNSR